MGAPHSGPGGVQVGTLLLLEVLGLVSGLSLEPVYWNSANKRFQAEGGYVLYPQIGDRLDLLCPRARPPGPHSSPNYEFYKLYLVGGAQGRRCEAPPAPNLLLTCDRPDLDLRFTIKFQEYSPNLWGHEFRSHHDYYIIATSDGTREGLESLQGGVCLTRGMKVPEEGLPPESLCLKCPWKETEGRPTAWSPGKRALQVTPPAMQPPGVLKAPCPLPACPQWPGQQGGWRCSCWAWQGLGVPCVGGDGGPSLRRVATLVLAPSGGEGPWAWGVEVGWDLERLSLGS
ncbi:ephrin-B3 isoform X2 [Bos indicus]|uniref:Ephrin-B3 isoform X2 n=1 Tax=Bos indicus TaxID=9915 RepID=A0ABM4R0N7_BOSIN|nr:ephrin-B3 isoform X2 [Bos indicus x Bos taurus]